MICTVLVSTRVRVLHLHRAFVSAAVVHVVVAGSSNETQIVAVPSSVPVPCASKEDAVYSIKSLLVCGMYTRITSEFLTLGVCVPSPSLFLVTVTAVMSAVQG